MPLNNPTAQELETSAVAFVEQNSPCDRNAIRRHICGEFEWTPTYQEIFNLAKTLVAKGRILQLGDNKYSKLTGPST